MSKIEVRIEDGILRIEKITSRYNSKNIEEIQLDLLEDGKNFLSNIVATNPKEKDKIFCIKRINDNTDVLVYSRNGKISYSVNTIDKEKMYKKLVKLRQKVFSIKLNKRNLSIKLLSFISNPYNLKIENQRFYIDEVLYKDCALNQYNSNVIPKIKLLTDNNLKHYKFKMKDILADESLINGSIRFCFNINGQEVNYAVNKRNKRIKEKRFYYLPMKKLYIKDFALHIRRTFAGSLILVKRRKEPMEYKTSFKLIESKIVSFLFYHIGKLFTNLRRTKINLFYEKFASKAEEGVFQLCEKCQQSEISRNYYVIDRNSPDYQKIKNNKFVVKKDSIKSYWLLYNANSFIASDAPNHLNIIRSNNKYIRKAIYEKKFVFLQHGIIYMKNLGENSHYKNGREASSEYIIASSEKEKDVIADMLQYDENQILKTGLGMYSNVEYNHINKDSKDVIMVMLTWKSYEEQLYHFEDSSYYKNVIEIFDMLRKYVNKEQIIIVGHPKANEGLKHTDINESLWKKSISEALKIGKLLITDYSSVCYNSFYQGAGVIFYQPDLEKYESDNGPLIPNDDEYIGKRVFNIDDLESVIKNAVINNKIDLSKVRTSEYEKMYKTINEFSDGKNIDRIYKNLVKLKFI